MYSRPVDMHVHTDDSPDAEIPASVLAERGRKQGLAGIGFVAHVDMNPDDYCYGYFSPEGYRASMTRARKEAGDSLRILAGLEVGEPHRYQAKVQQLVDYDDYDFITGALHHIGSIGMILGKEPFLESADPLSIVEEYYRITLKLVSGSDMDILAHMGLFRRGMALAGLNSGLDEVELWPELIREILSVLIDRGIALELNTSGLRREEKVTYPTVRVLSLYREMGGELVTLGSDSHRDPHIFFGLNRGMEILTLLNFSRAFFFHRREPKSYRLV